MNKNRKSQSQPVTSVSSTLSNGQVQDRVSTSSMPINSEEKCATCNEIDCILNGQNNKQVKVTSKWITCDICNQWYHGICQELQPTDVVYITKLADRGVSWKCSDCRNKTGDTVYGESHTESLNTRTTQQIDNIEKMVKTIAEHNDKLCEMEKKWSDIVKQNLVNIDKNKEIAVEAKMLMKRNHEIREEENRKNNAIVTGVTEKDGKTAIQQIQDLMKMECFTKSNIPSQAFRLGRKTESDEQKRPIKVRFEDEQSKWEFVKRFNNQTLKEQGIYCKLDESKEVRNHQFQLRKEVNRLRTENTSREYRVRNMQIQEKQGSGEWRVMKQVQQKKETEC